MRAVEAERLSLDEAHRRKLAALDPVEPADGAVIADDLLDGIRQRLDDRSLDDEQRQEIARPLIECRFPGVVQTHTDTRASQNYTNARRVVVV